MCYARCCEVSGEGLCVELCTALVEVALMPLPCMAAVAAQGAGGAHAIREAVGPL